VVLVTPTSCQASTIAEIAPAVVIRALRLKWSLQHLICLGVLFDGVWQAWPQTRAGVGA
jgi:hypothetical protein